MSEPWMTKAEIALALKVSVKTVERHIVPTMRVGGQNRYLLSHAREQAEGYDGPRDNVTPLRPGIRRTAA